MDSCKPNEEKKDERKLTDADVEAISAAMEERLVTRFYTNLGSGVWSMAWKMVILAIVGISAYGATKGH